MSFVNELDPTLPHCYCMDSSNCVQYLHCLGLLYTVRERRDEETVVWQQCNNVKFCVKSAFKDKESVEWCVQCVVKKEQPFKARRLTSPYTLIEDCVDIDLFVGIYSAGVIVILLTCGALRTKKELVAFWHVESY